MDVRMAAALAQGVDDVAAFCRAPGISRQSFYKWRKRFERDGLDGLRVRTRRPGTAANAPAVEVEDAVDGIRVAIFTGNTLLRALDDDPAKTYQPLGHEQRTMH